MRIVDIAGKAVPVWFAHAFKFGQDLQKSNPYIVIQGLKRYQAVEELESTGINSGFKRHRAVGQFPTNPKDRLF